ncbi:MAG TPA: hypothetical protein VJM31_19580 [Vicinamibacterales bacterium]|nr:hypothetical protein [Vicinamibacterales bacterium]
MEPDDLNDDERLSALFRAVEVPAPSGHFADRTMKAVRNAPLPAGRRALRNPLVGLVGWAALIAAVAIFSWALAATQPQFASALTRLVSVGIGVGVWSVQFAGAGLALSDVFTTTGLAVTRAVATREGSAGLMLIAAMGAFSLSALHRLLISEGPERGVSQWQEL